MIIVEGAIKAKERPRFNRVTGQVYTPGKTKTYENKIKAAFLASRKEKILGYVKVTIWAYFKIPKSYSKKRIEDIRKGKEYPVVKKDADNIGKIVLDALNKVAYNDDKQVVELIVLKRYTEEQERLEILVEPIWTE